MVFSTRGISIWLMLLKSVAPVHGTQWQTKHCFVFFNYILFLTWKVEIMMRFYVELKQTLKMLWNIEELLKILSCIVDILLWVTASDAWSLVLHEPVTASGLQTRTGKASALFTASSTSRAAVILRLSSPVATFSFTALEHARFQKVKAKEE